MKLFIDNTGSFINVEDGIDLSISFGGSDNVNAWYLDDPIISPVATSNFVGAVQKGAPVNFNNVFFNPHAHVTHTECLGHITKQVFSVNEIKHPLFYTARVVSIIPEIQENGDRMIKVDQLKSLAMNTVEAIVIRTLPNTIDKKNRKYSHSNPAFMDVKCAEYLESLSVQHLLIDLPSVDKEEDGGELAFHHAFWKVPDNPSFSKTITEFIYVPEECVDGDYLLNLQVAPIENDASPSRPILYKIFKA